MLDYKRLERDYGPALHAAIDRLGELVTQLSAELGGPEPLLSPRRDHQILIDRAFDAMNALSAVAFECHTIDWRQHCVRTGQAESPKDDQ